LSNDTLSDAGGNTEFCVRTKKIHELCPLHMASRMGCHITLKQFIELKCHLKARIENGEPALMLCEKVSHQECFMELLVAGDDLKLVNMDIIE
jgi:ankyrin repeat protein